MFEAETCQRALLSNRKKKQSSVGRFHIHIHPGIIVSVEYGMEESLGTVDKLCSLPLFVFRMSFRNVSQEVRGAALYYCLEGSQQGTTPLMSLEG